MQTREIGGKVEVLMNGVVIEVCDSQEFADQFIHSIPSLDEPANFESDLTTGFEDE